MPTQAVAGTTVEAAREQLQDLYAQLAEAREILLAATLRWSAAQGIMA